MVEGDQQQSLQQLTFDGRTFHRHDGFLGEDGHAFLDGPYIAVQLEVGQIIQEGFVKGAGGTQVVDILLGKGKMVHRIDKLLQARHDGVATPIRHAAEEHIKHRDLVPVALVQIAGGHRQLIEIGHGGQIAFHVQHGHTSCWITT